MNAFFKDIQFGNFISSEYGLIPISFDTNFDEEFDLALGSESDEEYIGRNTIPLDYGSNHQGKLEFTITFIKNTCSQNIDLEFSTYEIRSILRELTGNQYYKDLYFIDDSLHLDERVHYRVKVIETSAHKVSGKIIGIKVTFQNESFWGYTDEDTISMTLRSNQTFFFYNNSDELHNYLLPKIELSSITGNISIINISDNNRETIIKNIESNEKIILDARHDIISTSVPDKNIVDNFNLKWVKFIPGRNKMTVSSDCKIKITYQLLRKVVF